MYICTVYVRCFVKNVNIVLFQFVLVTKKYTWTQAQEYCESKYRGLVQMLDEGYQRALNDLLRSVPTATVWLGGNVEPDGSLFWAMGQNRQLANYQNWYDDYPQKEPNIQCLVTSYSISSKMMHVDCNGFNLSFVCVE